MVRSGDRRDLRHGRDIVFVATGVFNFAQAQIAIGSSLVLGVAVRLLLSRSRFGLAARATAEDRQAAMLRGVNTSQISLAAFAISGVAAGLCALVVAPVSYAVFDFGVSVVL
jgi:branched-chain amino acid transport system permease protein